MQLIASHHGKLLTLNAAHRADAEATKERWFSSGVAGLDALAPGGAFARGAIHELLTDPHDGKAFFMAMLLARGACDSFDSASSRFLVWCDADQALYPPALIAHGVRLDRLLLLRPQSPDPLGKNLKWALAECLRCRGVGAVIAAQEKLSRIEARRFQLAAESGGAVGLLLRPLGRDSASHAAASRWLVRPAPGTRTAQRWTIQLLHGHGGHVGQTLCMEHCRETNSLHTFDPMADRSAAPRPGVTRAS